MNAPAPFASRPSTLRGRAARLLVGATAVAAMLAPTGALAADAVNVKVLVDLAPVDGVTMDTVARPTNVGYSVRFANTNTSTLTQIVLTIDAPKATKNGVTGEGAYVDTFPNGDGACAGTATGVRCTLEQLKPGDGFNRTFVFSPPDYDSALIGADLRFPASRTVLSLKEGLNDSGARTDTFYPTEPDTDAQTPNLTPADRSTPLQDVVIGTGGQEEDFFSTYALPSGGTFGTSSTNIETNSTQLNATNKQATKVTVPATPRGTEATIEEIPTDLCPTNTCFGQGSLLTIPDLQAGDKIEVYIRWDASVIPAGVTNKNLKVAWDKTDTGAAWQPITAICNSTASNTPCRYAAVRFKDKDLGVKIVLDHNGLGKGYN